MSSNILADLFAIPARVEEVPFQNWERADCAVRAVTAVTNIPYPTVHEQFVKGGRKPGRMSANGLPEKVVRQLGFVLEPWEVTGKTIRTVERELPKKGRFLILVRGHMLAVINGKTVDWSAGRQHRIMNVWRITPQ
jgi:hypothetical protein